MAQILIVEDFPDICFMVRLILAEAGYTVDCVGDGLAALDRAARDQPDLILMDLGLPRLDGWEATRRLKENPVTQHIPVVAFTANVTATALARAAEAGCSAVIAKPFEIDTLLKQIAALIVRPLERAVGAECQVS